jgi:acetyltransferase-like isoleucine patch superfamily enzyme
MLSTIIGKLRYKLLLKWIKPEILPFNGSDSKRVSGTGVSNMTHVSNPSNVILENDIFVGHFNYIDGFKKVKIGKGCQITNYVSILTHSSHDSIRIDPMDLNHYGLVEGEVEIGENTYIGAHSVIMPGSKIGKGCIISAYSYVSGSFPDYSILRGQPAKVIGNTKERDKVILDYNPKALVTYYENF